MQSPAARLVEPPSCAAAFKAFSTGSAALAKTLGSSNVLEGEPVMGAEDFSEFGRAGIPSLQFNVGAVNPARYEASKKNGAPLPSLHSSEFAPDREPTLKTGVASLTVAALELLGKS